jgi:amidohydrolase
LCGHDVHIAGLVATVLTLAEFDLPYGLVATFQPREEHSPSGAADFVADRAFLDEGIAAMLGVHLQPVLPHGSFSVEPGAVNASADEFTIVIRGTSAHGAYPHLSRDPIVAAAALIQGIQQLVSRRIDPMHPAVVTVGRIAGGDAPNQVPGEVTMAGTIRAYSEVDRSFLHDGLRALASDLARAYGCAAEVEVGVGEPVLANDPGLAEALAVGLSDAGLTRSAPFRSCGADDFARYSQAFPSAMVFVGVGDGEPGSPGLHHPDFAPGDDIVGHVAGVYLRGYLAMAEHLTGGQPIPDARR